MEQIYYTQCPVGYGLGASNGFQVKRLSPGYPLSGDFRHLGLRAFLPGSRALAPPVLRYRLAEDGVAELAWLTPRSHEYETERGLWGRPGGHFAHGVRLDDGAIRAVRGWPAGLFGQPFWRRSDPSPTLGRPPDPLDFGPSPLRLPPDYSTASGLAAGLDAGLLASLLTATAVAARDGRTLVVIDRPDRLADVLALLTLAFPEAWRGPLTFSTYHDRPEELPGFRLQGTAPDPRANRGSLRALGALADLTAVAVEPAVAPARWATTLAGWLVGGSDRDRDAWEATDRRASAARPSGPAWSDDWLDRLYDLPARLTLAAPDWRPLGELAAWGRENGLGPDVAQARGPDWWREQAAASEAGRRALAEHLKIAESWHDRADAWGSAVARWLEPGPADRRSALLAEAFGAAPVESRPGFVRGLVGASSPEVAREVLRWLRSQPGVDPAVLLPLEARRAAELGAGGLRDVLARAAARGCLTEALDALPAGETARRAVGALLAVAESRTARQVVRWALGRGDEAGGWLGPFLRSAAAGPDAVERWAAVGAWVEPDRRADFARAALHVAGEPGVPDEVFRWAVETWLLPLPEPDRPAHPDWPGLYVDRTPSGLDLLRRLFAREYRDLGVKRWLDEARGDLSPSQAERVEGCVRFARALQTGDARAVARVGLPSVPPAERGALLSRVLGHVGTGSDEDLGPALDACRAAWPGGLDPGAEGLSGVGAALAERLLAGRDRPDAWLDRLARVARRLGAGGGFEPDGLAAEVIAATARRPGPGFSPWRFRASLLQNDLAWRALGEDVRRELRGRGESEGLAALEVWDRSLAKGVHSARFFEVWLNGCDGPALASAVAARANDLRTLPALRWWRWREHEPEGASDDLRDAFARLAPMAPLVIDALTAVQTWMRAASTLSDDGRARWRCVEALTAFHRPGLGADACWQAVEGWTRDLPLGRLAEPERYRFLAWLIPRLEGSDGARVARLAAWLVRSGMTDPDRVDRWAEELGPRADAADGLRRARASLVAELRGEWKTLLREARQRVRKTPEPGSPGSR